MKKRMRRVLGAALSLVMAVGLLSGCSSYDPVKEVMGYSRSTVMFTVNGNDVTAGQFFFWMAQNADTVASYSQMSGSTEIDWSTPMGDDMTMDEYVKEQSKEAADSQGSGAGQLFRGPDMGGPGGQSPDVLRA